MAEAESHHSLPLPRFERAPRLALIAAPFYRDIADMLIAGARRTVEAVGGRHELFEVPGALEIPPAVRILAQSGEFDGFVALGCVIRGETSHYETVCNDSSRGLMLLGLEGLCIGNGILTVENRAQAVVRADPEQADKGGGAAAAALHLIALRRQVLEQPRGIGFRPAPIRIAEDGDEGGATARDGSRA